MASLRGRHHPYQPVNPGSRENSFYLINNSTRRRSSFFDNNIEYEEGGENNVISYDISSLLCHGCWDKGSPFNKRLLCILLLEVIISTTLGHFKCPHDKEFDYHCIPLPDNTTGLTLLTITSFLVGMFSNNVLQRWWSIRVSLGFVINKSKTLAVSASSVVAFATHSSSPEIKEEAFQFICKVHRYLNLAHALIYKNADGDDNLSDLLERCLITPEEAVILQQASDNSSHNGSSTMSKMPFQLDVENSCTDDDASLSSAATTPVFSPYNVYGWITLNLESAAAMGLLGGSHQMPVNHIAGLKYDLGLIETTAAEVGMYLGVQLPYEFARMTVVIVYMFLVQLIVVCGGLIGEGFLTGDMSLVVTGYMTSVLMSFVMLSILNMYDVLSAKALSNLPTTTFMHQEEEQMAELCKSVWASSSHKDSRGNFIIVPNFSFDRDDVMKHDTDRKPKTMTV